MKISTFDTTLRDGTQGEADDSQVEQEISSDNWQDDPRVAAESLSAAFPDPEDRAIVEGQLRRSIEIARETTPYGWSASLFTDGVRVNVGPVEVVTAFGGRLRVLLSDLPTELRNIYSSALVVGAYKSVAGENLIWSGVPAQFAAISYQLLPHHDVFVRKAGTTRAGLPFPHRRFKGHSNGLVEYLMSSASNDFPLPPTVEPNGHGSEFDPASIEDLRRRTIAEITLREGQDLFRAMLLRAYENRCAITACNVEPALEAAHIVPYKGLQSNHVSNGILLRADLHKLFDQGLLAINSATMTVLVSPSIAATEYGYLSGVPVKVPSEPELRPSVAALNRHLLSCEELSTMFKSGGQL